MKSFGRYEILDEIGQGAMGAVFKARDPVMDRVVAIKTILAHAAEGPQAADYRERFFREARAAGRLSHPGIVTIYDVAEQEGTPFLVMEFIAGRTLESVLEAGERFSIEQTQDMGIQLADALGYAHANGVIHRDIKPANILLTADGRAKIADFGVAKLATVQVTATGQMLGTPAFMAPEQFTGSPIDGRADLFALGVILYWMATGDKPFTGDTLMAVSYKIVHTNPIPPRKLNPAIPRHLELVLLKCMQKDPAERYASGEALAQDLRALREGRPPVTQFADATAPSAERTVVSSGPVLPGDLSPDEMDTMETMAIGSPAVPASAHSGISSQTQTQAPAPAATQATAAPAKPVRHNHVRTLAFTLIAIASIVGILNLAREVLKQRAAESPKIIVPAGGVTVSPPLPPNADAPDKRPPKSPAGKPAGAESAKAGAHPAAKTMRLEFRSSDRAIVVLQPKGQANATYHMRPGDMVKVEAEEEATLFTDNAGALRISLNGKELAPLGEGRTPRQVVLTPQGIDESRSPDMNRFPGTRVIMPGKIPDPREIQETLDAVLGRSSLSSPRMQSILAAQKESARLQIESPALPAAVFVTVRVGKDVLFRREGRGTLPAQPERATAEELGSAPLSELRFLPSGKHTLIVSVSVPGRRFGHTQEFATDFTPKQTRKLRIIAQRVERSDTSTGRQPPAPFVITLE